MSQEHSSNQNNPSSTKSYRKTLWRFLSESPLAGSPVCGHMSALGGSGDWLQSPRYRRAGEGPAAGHQGRGWPSRFFGPTVLGKAQGFLGSPVGQWEAVLDLGPATLQLWSSAGLPSFLSPTCKCMKHSVWLVIASLKISPGRMVLPGEEEAKLGHC